MIVVAPVHCVYACVWVCVFVLCVCPYMCIVGVFVYVKPECACGLCIGLCM